MSAHASDVAVVYLCRYAERSDPLRRFVEAYVRYAAGVRHELHVIFEGFPSAATRAAADGIIGGLRHIAVELPDTRFDIGAFLTSAERITAERICVLNSSSRPLAAGWLAKLDAALSVPGVGLAGATGSWKSIYSVEHPNGCPRSMRVRDLRRFLENRVHYPSYPNPHLRTNGFMIRRDLLLRLCLPIPETQEDVVRLESGRRSITRQVLARNLDVVVVGRDGTALQHSEWAKAAIFWQGDQQELLIADDQTDHFARADPDARVLLQAMQWARPGEPRGSAPSAPEPSSGLVRIGAAAWRIAGSPVEIRLPMPAGHARRIRLSFVGSSRGYVPVRAWLVARLQDGTELRHGLGRLEASPRLLGMILINRRSTASVALMFSPVRGARIALDDLRFSRLTYIGLLWLLLKKMAGKASEGAGGASLARLAATTRSMVRGLVLPDNGKSVAVAVNRRMSGQERVPQGDADPALVVPGLGTPIQIALCVLIGAGHARGRTDWRNSVEAAGTVPSVSLFLATTHSDAATLSWIEGAALAVNGTVRLTLTQDAADLAAAELVTILSSDASYVVVTDDRHLIEPRLFAAIREYVAAQGNFDGLYVDEETLRDDDPAPWPVYKPDWSPELAACSTYIGGVIVYRVDALRRLDEACLQRWGLRGAETLLGLWKASGRIVHLPDILARRLGGWPAGGDGARPRGTVERVTHERRISIIIPTAGRHDVVRRRTIDLVRDCVCSILSAFCPDGLEIIVIHDDNLTDATACELGARGVKLMATSNFETVNLARKMNRGAAAASGDLLVFMNDDVEVISPDWLERLAGHVGRNGVGIVGALLRYEDGAIQHAGAYVRGSVVEHVYRGAKETGPGYLGWLRWPRDCSAVTGACLMIARPTFAELGGFDENFPILFNDIDLCLQARRHGWRVLLEPQAQLFHFEGRSRGVTTSDKDEVRLFRQRWGQQYLDDPFYPWAFAGPVPETPLNRGDAVKPARIGDDERPVPYRKPRQTSTNDGLYCHER